MHYDTKELAATISAATAKLTSQIPKSRFDRIDEVQRPLSQLLRASAILVSAEQEEISVMSFADEPSAKRTKSKSSKSTKRTKA